MFAASGKERRRKIKRKVDESEEEGKWRIYNPNGERILEDLLFVEEGIKIKGERKKWKS